MTATATTAAKAVAVGLALALLTILAAVSIGPSFSFLSSQAASQQCTSTGLSTGGEAIPIPSGDPDVQLAFRAASWNVLKSNNVRNVAAALQEIAGTADVVGLQEFREKFRGTTIKDALPGWAWSDQNTSVPIAWNTNTFELVAKARVLEFGVTRVAGGPVGRSAGPKYAEWVQLRQKSTGATVVVVNHHLLYSIESHGRPDRRVGKRYLALAQRQMRVERDLVDRFAALGLPVVVTKDGNWDYRKSARTKDPRSPYIQAARVGLHSNWQVLGMPKQGTQASGTRLIDSVSSTTGTLIPVQQTVLGTPRHRFHGSDHRPPVVALTNSGAAITASLTKAAAVASTTTADGPGQGRAGKVAGVNDDQMRVARSIYTTTLQVGREQGWSAADTDRAFQIAVSTAQKESTLGADPRSKRPDSNGDGGIYGQRTKAGWYGTIDQVNDPGYGTRVFLLGKKVTAADVAAAHRSGAQAAGPAGYTIPGLQQISGWQRLPLGVASHRIQRSAYPSMPAAFEKIARALLQAFDQAGLAATSRDVDQAMTGGCPNLTQASSTMTCPATSMPAENYPLTPDALLVTRCVAQQFPQITTIGTYTGHQPDLTRAVDIMIPRYTTATGKALGRQVRDWVQQHAAELGLDYLIWNEQIWSTQRAGEGWRQCGTAAAGCYSGPDDSASHRNHVHVSVLGDKGAGAGLTDPAGSGSCPLDIGYAAGHKNPKSCEQALEFVHRQDATNSRQWYRSCLALVANAYGWGGSGVGTAGEHALLLKRAGKLHTSRTNIPRGAVLWWTNSGAGHVAIFDGTGYIYSNDVITDGEVSRVRWDFPEKNWGQHFEGWSAPYFPQAGGSAA